MAHLGTEVRSTPHPFCGCPTETHLGRRLPISLVGGRIGPEIGMIDLPKFLLGDE